MASAPSPTRQLDMSHLPRPCYSNLSRQTHCTATRPHAGVTDARRPLPRASEGLPAPRPGTFLPGLPGLLQAPPHNPLQSAPPPSVGQHRLPTLSLSASPVCRTADVWACHRRAPGRRAEPGPWLELTEYLLVFL